MTLLIDNYDSFSYNLYQYAGTFDEIKVIRNDDLSVKEIISLNPDRIILSPGPGRPENAGVIVELIQKLEGKIPLLGICLGHQAIAQAYGGKITYAKELMHAKVSNLKTDPEFELFKGLSSEFPAGRYHSLSVENKSLPDVLKVSALSDDGEIMAFKHKDYPVYGLQFHPESILTPDGLKIIENFMKLGDKND